MKTITLYRAIGFPRYGFKPSTIDPSEGVGYYLAPSQELIEQIGNYTIKILTILPDNILKVKNETLWLLRIMHDPYDLDYLYNIPPTTIWNRLNKKAIDKVIEEYKKYSGPLEDWEFYLSRGGQYLTEEAQKEGYNGFKIIIDDKFAKRDKWNPSSWYVLFNNPTILKQQIYQTELQKKYAITYNPQGGIMKKTQKLYGLDLELLLEDEWEQEMTEDFFFDQDTGVAVGQDAPQPVQGQELNFNGQTLVEPKPVQPEAQPQQQQVPPTEQTPQPNEQNQPLPEAINFFEGEGDNKTFNAENAYNFLQQKERTPFSVERPPVAPQAAPIQPPMTPEGPASQEPDLRQTLSGVIGMVQDNINAGLPVDQALKAAEAQLMNQVDSYQNQQWKTDIEQKQAEQYKAFEEKQALAAMAPTSRANLQRLATEGNWGSGADLQSVMLDPKYGGAAVVAMYKMQNPEDYKNLDEKAYGESLQNFFTKISADNETVRLLEEFSRARLYNEMQPHLIQHARKVQANESLQQRQSSTPAVANMGRAPVQNNQNDTFSNWLNAPPGGDRV